MTLHSPVGLGGLLTKLRLDKDTTVKVIVSSNSLLIFFGRHLTRPAVIHWSTAGYRDRLVAKHIENLQWLATSTIKDIVPELLRSGSLANRRVMAQSWLSGQHFKPSKDDPESLLLKLSAALEPLKVLAQMPPNSVAADANFIGSSLASLAIEIPQHARLFRRTLRWLEEWIAERGLVPVPVHGDYGFRNILFGDEGSVCGIIDWDRMRHDGLPYVDAFHLLMNCLNECQLCSHSEFITNLWQPKWRHPLAEQCLAHVVAKTGCRPEDLPFIGAMLWLSLIYHGYVETPPPDEAWLERVVTEPAKILAATMA